MNDLGGIRGEIRLLRIQIATLRRERDDLHARAAPDGRGERLVLRAALAALWLAGAASVLVLVLYVLLMTGIFRMAPG